MAELLSFLRLCAASGTLVGSLCGLVFVPFLTWLAVRALTPCILRMRDDAAWQAPIAAIAATAPGATFLILALVGLFGAAAAGCLAFMWGRVLFGVITVLLVLGLVRAAVRTYGRSSEVRKLINASQSANVSIGIIAQRCGVRVRVLNYADAFCALVGFWNPVVLISRATLGRLSCEELESALLHERGHAARLDLVLAGALSFFADLLPLPAGDLVETYARTRERAADEWAVRNCDPATLASAIVAVATTRRVRAAAALAEEPHTVKQRVLALLSAKTEHANRGRRLVACVSLGTIIALSVTPAVLSATNFYVCSMKGMHI